MATYIQIFALFVSLGVLVIQYRTHKDNQKEKMTNLRSSLLGRLISIKQRTESDLININSIRILLRTVEDSDEKYDLIEEMPELIKYMEEIKRKIENIVKRIKDVNITKVSIAIDTFQEIQIDVITLESLFEELEKKILKELEDVKIRQK